MAGARINDVGATLMLLNKGSINDVQKWIFEKCAKFSNYFCKMYKKHTDRGEIGAIVTNGKSLS
jgi:hypothetical protein